MCWAVGMGIIAAHASEMWEMSACTPVSSCSYDETVIANVSFERNTGLTGGLDLTDMRNSLLTHCR